MSSLLALTLLATGCSAGVAPAASPTSPSNPTSVSSTAPPTSSPDSASSSPLAGAASVGAVRGIDFQLESLEGYTWRLEVTASGSGKVVTDGMNAPPGKQAVGIDLTPSGANVNTTPGKNNPVPEHFYYSVIAVVGSDSTDCRNKYGLAKVPGGCALGLASLGGSSSSAKTLQPNETLPMMSVNYSSSDLALITEAQVAALVADVSKTLRLGVEIRQLDGLYGLKPPWCPTYEPRWIIDGKCQA